MIASIAFSTCLARAILGRWFLLSHRVMTLSGLGGMLWHVLKQPQVDAQCVVGISAVIWVIFTVYRLCRLFGRRLSAEIVHIRGDSGILEVEVELRRPVRVAPGTYFNIFFPGVVAPYALLHSYSAVAYWHHPDDVTPCERISNISFLLSRRGSHAVALAQLAKSQRVLLEGPFGKNLNLNRYENIILAAEGIGIAGVLPLALELAERKRHDDRIRDEIQLVSQQLEGLRTQAANPETGEEMLEQRRHLLQRRSSLLKKPLFRDATRKVDIFWSLQNNANMTAIQAQLYSLQRLDPENVSHYT